MKSNYTAWDVNLDALDTPGKFVSVAVLAPSSHNSQPWEFLARGDMIEARLATKRLLPESDTNDRQALISLGCAIANIELLADYHGFDCVVKPGKDPVAVLSFTKRPVSKKDSDHLALVILKRVTNRSPHEARELDSTTIDVIRALAGQGLRIDMVTDSKRVSGLGKVAIEAGIESLDSPGFRRELSQYLKPNGTRSYVGMPGFGFGFPPPMAAIAPLLIKRFNMERISRKQNEKLFSAHTAGILVISTASDTVTDWLKVGRIYERIALIATRAGMSTAPWAATVQIGDYYREVQRVLGMTERPQFFCRIGYPTKPVRHSPRIPSSMVSI